MSERQCGLSALQRGGRTLPRRKRRGLKLQTRTFQSQCSSPRLRPAKAVRSPTRRVIACTPRRRLGTSAGILAKSFPVRKSLPPAPRGRTIGFNNRYCGIDTVASILWHRYCDIDTWPRKRRSGKDRLYDGSGENIMNRWLLWTGMLLGLLVSDLAQAGPISRMHSTSRATT